MDIYLFIKTIHILSGAVLFGTGMGIAFFCFQSRGAPDPAARYFAIRNTVLADFLFTLPAVVIQPITGFWMIAHSGYPPTDVWLMLTYGLYILAGICWVPVVFIQLRLRLYAKQSALTGDALPAVYHRLFRIWFLLGWPAFIGLVVVYFLMVLKPTW